MAIGFFWTSVCLCVFVAILALDIMGLFSRKNHFDVNGKVLQALTDYTARKLCELTVSVDGAPDWRLARHGTRSGQDSGTERGQCRYCRKKPEQIDRSVKVHICTSSNYSTIIRSTSLKQLANYLAHWKSLLRRAHRLNASLP